MSIISAHVLPHLQVLVPEIGQGKEEGMKKTTDSIKAVAERIAGEEPDTLIILSSHADAYEDYFHIAAGEGMTVTLEDYGVEGLELDMKYDLELISEITKVCGEVGIDAGTEGEETNGIDHATEVPMYFIQPVMKNNYKVVRISVSGLSYLKHYEYGKCIKDAVEHLGRKAVVIASGDLSHTLKEDGPFGYAKEGSIFDTALCSALETGNFLGLFAFEPEVIEKSIECF